MPTRKPLLFAGAVGLLATAAWLGLPDAEPAALCPTPVPAPTADDTADEYSAADAAAPRPPTTPRTSTAPTTPQRVPVERRDAAVTPGDERDPGDAPRVTGSSRQQLQLRVLRQHARSVGLELAGAPTTLADWTGLDDVHRAFADRLDEAMTTRALLLGSLSRQRHAQGQLERVAGTDRTADQQHALRRAMRPQFPGQLTAMVADPTGAYVCRINQGEHHRLDELSTTVEQTLALYVDAARNYLR